MLEMLAFLANHYKHTPHILGYEVMSEPRFRGKDSLVHTFHGEACKKVHSFDPRAACVIGYTAVALSSEIYAVRVILVRARGGSSSQVLLSI